jgi:hypothetical protein
MDIRHFNTLQTNKPTMKISGGSDEFHDKVFAVNLVFT